jgi:hypothetical protein
MQCPFGAELYRQTVAMGSTPRSSLRQPAEIHQDQRIIAVTVHCHNKTANAASMGTAIVD